MPQVSIENFLGELKITPDIHIVARTQLADERIIMDRPGTVAKTLHPMI
jgi:hypothetical protein